MDKKDNSVTHRTLDYPNYLKYLISAYCGLLLVFGPFYLLGLFEGVVKISVLFSITFGIFYLFSSIIGYTAIFVKNPTFKLIYGHSLLFQMILSITLIGTTFYFVDSIELQKDFAKKFSLALLTGDSKDVDPIQNYFQCCGTNYQNKKQFFNLIYSTKSNLDKIDTNFTKKLNSVSSSLEAENYLATGLFDKLLSSIPKELYLDNQNETNSKNYLPIDDKLPFDLPKSCCKKSNLDKNNKCKYKLSHKNACSYIFDEMFKSYRVLSASVLIFNFIFQSILYSLFRINIRHLIPIDE